MNLAQAIIFACLCIALQFPFVHASSLLLKIVICPIHNACFAFALAPLLTHTCMCLLDHAKKAL